MPIRGSGLGSGEDGGAATGGSGASGHGSGFGGADATTASNAAQDLRNGDGDRRRNDLRHDRWRRDAACHDGWRHDPWRWCTSDVWCAPRWSSGWSFAFSSWGGGWSFGVSYSSGWSRSGWCGPWHDPCGWPAWRPVGWCAPGPFVGSSWWHDPFATPWRSACWRPYAWRPVCWTAPDPCSWTVCHADPCWTPWWSCHAPTVVCASWYGSTPWTISVSTTSTLAPAAAVFVAPPPDPDAAWTLLAEGFDVEARRDFALLGQAAPDDARHAVGEALALAFSGQTARASDRLRDALATDPGAMHAIPMDARLAARLESLERALAPLASSRVPSIDALLLLSACQSARGDLATAYFSASQARELGDRSIGTAESVAWLAEAMRQRL
jgi:hypothetical protein